MLRRPTVSLLDSTEPAQKKSEPTLANGVTINSNPNQTNKRPDRCQSFCQETSNQKNTKSSNRRRSVRQAAFEAHPHSNNQASPTGKPITKRNVDCQSLKKRKKTPNAKVTQKKMRISREYKSKNTLGKTSVSKRPSRIHQTQPSAETKKAKKPKTSKSPRKRELRTNRSISYSVKSPNNKYGVKKSIAGMTAPELRKVCHSVNKVKIALEKKCVLLHEEIAEKSDRCGALETIIKEEQKTHERAFNELEKMLSDAKQLEVEHLNKKIKELRASSKHELDELVLKLERLRRENQDELERVIQNFQHKHKAEILQLKKELELELNRSKDALDNLKSKTEKDMKREQELHIEEMRQMKSTMEGKLRDEKTARRREVDELASKNDEALRTQKKNYERKITDLEESLEDSKNSCDSLSGKLSKSKMKNCELQQELDENEELLTKNKKEMRKLKESLEQYKAECSMVQGVLDARTQERNLLKKDNARLREEGQTYTMQIENMEATCKKRDEEIVRLKLEIVEFENNNKNLNAQITNLNSKLEKEEKIRKYLHNEIQTLKGNIRVFCRVRPVLKKEENAKMCFSYPQSEDEKECIKLVRPSSPSLNNSSTRKWDYRFDKVFNPTHTQALIFEEISQLVQSALDGYKVCIFAYGQTGSGKTYTMEGPESSLDGLNENAGMIPRSVAQIFDHAEKLKERHWKFECKATYLEIYNERIRDLLRSEDKQQKLEIVQRNKKKKDLFEVPGLKEVIVTSSSEVFPILYQAKKNRSTASTECNDVSSRSHSLFQLFLNGFNSESKQTVNGVMNLIDLAGSERLKISKAQGQRLKETKAINKSLSNLGDVIMALAAKQNHIPYRNSALTKLLMNYLGGDSKTLMFVNLCPDQARWEESLCSLRFAAKVNACDIGTARRTVSS